MTIDVKALLAKHPTPWSVLLIDSTFWCHVLSNTKKLVAICDDKDVANLIAAMGNALAVQMEHGIGIEVGWYAIDNRMLWIGVEKQPDPITAILAAGEWLKNKEKA